MCNNDEVPAACEEVEVENTLDCGGECHADCKDPEACEVVLPEREDEAAEADAPDTQQIFMALSSVILNEFNNANTRYPEFYHSSTEGAGTIQGECTKVIALLSKMKVVGSQTFAGDDFNKLSLELLTACVQLNVVSMKAIMSFCDTVPICEKFSKALEQQQQVAEMLHAGEQGEAADEPTI